MVSSVNAEKSRVMSIFYSGGSSFMDLIPGKPVGNKGITEYPSEHFKWKIGRVAR